MPAILKGAPRFGKRSRLPFLAGILTLPPLLALAFLFSGCPSGRSAAAAHPSILLITLDSMRADRAGYTGHKEAKTPSLDALAARSVRFTDAFSPSPLTLPAVASLLTGHYPHETGVRLEGRHTLAAAETTLAEALSTAGYRTGAIGGSLLLHPRHGLNQGFAQYLDAFGEIPRPREASMLHFAARRVGDRALEWLEGAHREPYFLWVNFHDLYEAGEAGVSYDAALAVLDAEVGRIVSRVGEYGEEEKTLIVLAGTHGSSLGDHGEELHGTLLYQSTQHVPMLVKPAGGAIAGRDVAGAVGLIDLMPTILEVAGVAAPSGLSGRSLLASITSEGAAVDATRVLLAETSQPAALFGWSSVTAARAGSYKYVSSGGGRLFDLSADPSETKDVSAAHPDEARRLSAAAAAIPAWQPPACAECGATLAGLGLAWPAAGRADGPVDPESKIEVANLALKARRTLRRRQVESAELLYKEVLSQDPDNLLALRDLGLITGLRQNLPEARTLLTKAQRLYAADAEIYHVLGHLSLVEKDGQPRATALFTLAGRLDPLNEEALYDAACGTALAGDTRGALGLLEQAVAAGFRDFPHMRKDKDLDSLRAEERFKKILPDLPSSTAGGAAPAAPGSTRAPAPTAPGAAPQH